MSQRRTYVSPYRVQAAAENRAAIIRQAAALLAERGYGRVTVADIAAAAGVAPKTVFASVGSKADLLAAVVDEAVRESGYEQAVADIAQTRTQDAAVRLLSQRTRVGNQTQSAALEAVHKALPVHENGEALWRQATAAYREALVAVAGHLASIDALPSGLSVERAADLLWLWFGPAAWRTLVVECQWSWDDAEEILYRTALATLSH